MTEPLCPRCPVCDSHPNVLHPMLAQAWCENDACEVLCWDPWSTLEQNLMDAAPAIVTQSQVEYPEP